MDGEVLGLLKTCALAAVDDLEQQGLILLVNVLLVIGVLCCLLLAPPTGGGSIFCRQTESAVKEAESVWLLPSGSVAAAQWECGCCPVGMPHLPMVAASPAGRTEQAAAG